METIPEQHRAPAAGMQEEHHQHELSDCNASGGLAVAGSSEHATAVGNSWSQPVEEEYINVGEAVEADALSFGNDAADSISESSSDEEATAEGAAEMVEEIPADVSMDTSEACATSSPVASFPADSASVPLAAYCDGGESRSRTTVSTPPVSIGEDLTLRTALEVVLKGARDALCCAAVGAVGACGEAIPANTDHDAVLLAALGSCDDACRVYVLPASAQQQQGDTSGNRRPCAGNSSRRNQQKGAAPRQKMGAAATLREGHETVSAAAFSFDNQLLACGCFDGIVRVYRPQVTRTPNKANTRSPLSCRSHVENQGPLTQLERVVTATQPEAEGLAAQYAGGRRIEGVRPPDLPVEMRRNGDVAEDIGVSVDLVEELRGCTADVVDVAFHPRGYALLVASADHTAWVWLLPPSIVKDSTSKASGSRGAVPLTVFAGAAPLTCGCFSSSGREGIVGAVDGTVSVFSAKNGALLYVVKHPGIALPVRQRQQEQQQEPCSVVTLRLSSSCSAVPLMRRRLGAGGHSDDPSAIGDVCRPVHAVAGAAAGEPASEAKSLTNEKEQPEDILLGVGYENGWIALIRAAGGDVILAEQEHAHKAVESVSFIKITAGNRAMATRAAEEKYGFACCYLFASGGLDGRVLIWDVTHKCIRAVVVAADAAPVPGVANCIDSGKLQRQLTSAAGVTRLVVLQGFHLDFCGMHSEALQPESRREHQWLQQQHHVQQFQMQQQLLRGVALICAGCTDGRLLVLDIRTGQVLLQWQAHVGAVMDLVALPVEDDTATTERRATAEQTAQPGALGGNAGVGLSQQQQGVSKCSCCWRILSAGDDGLGKVWRVFLSIASGTTLNVSA